MASLVALDGLDPEEEIRLYVNCPAGSPYAVAGVLDAIRSLRAPVSTIGIGYSGGAASVLLAGGTKGRRCAMANARIMLVQPNGGAMGSADEVNIQASELNRNMKLMYSYVCCDAVVAAVSVRPGCVSGLWCVLACGSAALT